MKSTIVAFLAIACVAGSAFAQGEFKYKTKAELEWEITEYEKGRDEARVATYGEGPQFSVVDLQFNHQEIIQALIVDQDGIQVCEIQNLSIKLPDEGHVTFECDEFVGSVYIDSHGWFDDEIIFKFYEPGSSTSAAYAQVYDDDATYVEPQRIQESKETQTEWRGSFYDVVPNHGGK